MRSIIYKVLLVAITVTAFSSRTVAQNSTLLGEWKLKEKTLVTGKDFNNAIAPAVSFRAKGDSVTVKKSGDPNNVRIIYKTTERTYFPGKKQVAQNDGVNIARSFAWVKDQHSAELITAGSKKGAADQPGYQFKDIWTLDPATGQLQVEMSFKSEEEPENFCTFKAVYERLK